jgi:hypothetical protein
MGQKQFQWSYLQLSTGDQFLPNGKQSRSGSRNLSIWRMAISNQAHESCDASKRQTSIWSGSLILLRVRQTIFWSGSYDPAKRQTVNTLIRLLWSCTEAASQHRLLWSCLETDSQQSDQALMVLLRNKQSDLARMILLRDRHSMLWAGSYDPAKRQPVNTGSYGPSKRQIVNTLIKLWWSC